MTPCPRSQCSCPSFPSHLGSLPFFTLLTSKPDLWARLWLRQGRRGRREEKRTEEPSPAPCLLLLLFLPLNTESFLSDTSAFRQQGAHSEGASSAQEISRGELTQVQHRWNEAATRGRTSPLIQPLN